MPGHVFRTLLSEASDIFREPFHGRRVFGCSHKKSVELFRFRAFPWDTAGGQLGRPGIRRPGPTRGRSLKKKKNVSIFLSKGELFIRKLRFSD